MSKKYKYLKYIPKPKLVDSSLFDLVDDTEFCLKDNRVPLLIITQFGIFPARNYPGKKSYQLLHGLENQSVAFFRRAYPTPREYEDIIEINLDATTLFNFRNGSFKIDYTLRDER
jgi:hypothetical protein